MAIEGGTDLTERIRQNVPALLRNLPAWLFYDAEKTPIYADGSNRYGTLDSSEDRERLVTFEEAAAAFPAAAKRRTARSQTPPVGYGIALGDVPGEEIRLCGIDLDACYRGEGLGQLAMQILAAADSYAERSPSGSGLHVLGTGNVGTLKVEKATNRPGLELYSGSRYFTVTGDRINGANINDITEAAVLARQLLGAQLRSDEDGEDAVGQNDINCRCSLHATVGSDP